MANETPLKDAKIPFDGPVQSGIEQAPQAHLSVLALDLDEGATIEQFQDLMQRWTTTARLLTQGQKVPGFEAWEMVEVPANLTITCGFGERIFDFLGRGERKPAGLHDLPAFKLDKLEEQWGQSDLVLQLCGDDLVTLNTAARLLVKAAEGTAHWKWVQKGYGHAFGAVPSGTTPRNPMGQVDGTINPGNPEEYNEQVWIESDDPAIDKSSIMVIRRIAMDLDAWDGVKLKTRDRVIGRHFHSGGPLSGGGEFDDEDMDAKDEKGRYLIDRHSHLALSREQDGQPSDALRRRAYGYDDAPIPGRGYTNSGLVWIAFQKNPDLQFTAIQKRLDESDLLNHWVNHIGSAVYWIVPGTDADTYWGQALIES
ncbi:MAG: Dyp-type peroxidase [Varibaculum sp.]|nr:Dyp-type peroxidase [Varibaculum sp.]